MTTANHPENHHRTGLRAAAARAAGLLAKTLVFYLAGAGPGVLICRFALHDYHGYTPALSAGSAFGIVFLILALFYRTDETEDFLGAAGAAALASAILGAVLASAKRWTFYETVSWTQIFLLFAGAGIGGAIAQLTPVARAFFRRLRRWLYVPGAAAIGSGMGLVLGFVIDPDFGPSMVQDGAALCGGVAGGGLGVLLAAGSLYCPQESEPFSYVVIGGLSLGALSAPVIRFGAAFVTPLSILGLDLACYLRQSRRAPGRGV